MTVAAMKALAMLENEVSRKSWASELRKDAKAADVTGPASELVTRVVAEVAVVTGILTTEIRAKTRVPSIVRARHFAWFKLAELGLSASEIGRAFSVDHSTVLHGVDNIRTRLGRQKVRAA